MSDSNLFKYSKKKYNLAGSILRKDSYSESEKEDALLVLSNWRSAHSYPMNVFKNRLDRISKKLDSNYLSAQRLKRVPSIVKKLNRFTIRLTQIQDLAGCRVILSDVKLARKLYEDYYLDGDLKHTLVSTNDYITFPKFDGYRSFHLVYKYFTDKENKKDYTGLLVEVQIRSKLQHIWATAVETASFFIGQELKLDKGDADWMRFFSLVSSAFSIIEKTPLVPETPVDKDVLYSEIKSLANKLDVVNKMVTWTQSIKDIEKIKKSSNNHFFLLKLDLNLKKLDISTYSKRQENSAFEDYASYEKDIYDKSGYDVVLVGSASLSDLKKSYPNYFLDTHEFLKYLKEILD